MTNVNRWFRTPRVAMRLAVAFAALLTLGMLDAATPAAAQGAWCAQYSGQNGGPTNCGFYTWEQCRWAVSGVGGFCSPNPWASDQLPPRRRARRQY